MTPLLNTVIIQHQTDPDNIIKLSKKKQVGKRLFAYIERIGHDTFSDDDNVQAKLFEVRVSEADWLEIRDKPYAWILETGPDLPIEVDIQQWYDQWLTLRNEIANRILDKLSLDKTKYRVSAYDKEYSFGPIPTLYEIMR